MTDRVINFSPGPGTLPLPVLERVRDDVVSLAGVGASPLEVSHRGRWFMDVIERAREDLRALLAIPAGHHVIFCQGGATLQFSMAPMNLLRGSGRHADHVVTGAWGAKALVEARREGEVRVAWSGEDGGYRRTPSDDELADVLRDDAAYVYMITNETIQGVAFPAMPAVPHRVPLVADASSDFLSGPVRWDDVGLLFAGAQKNAGPAGVVVAVVRDDMLERIPEGLPTLLDYRTYVEHGSLANTPPVFAIYVVGLVLRWLIDEVGGIEAMAKRNRRKAALLYDEIDRSGGFYAGHAEPGSRSLMNVTFRLPSEDLERAFIAVGAEEGLVELRGHRSVGGIRASIYNAMPIEGVEALASFMRAFRDRNA
jgi:phosphoserine aminotransferase